MTNVGISIKLPLSPLKISPEFLMAAISGWKMDSNGNPQRIRIYLQKVHEIETNESPRLAYRRVRCHEFELLAPHTDLGRREDIFVLENEQFELIALMKGAGAGTLDGLRMKTYDGLSANDDPNNTGQMLYSLPKALFAQYPAPVSIQWDQLPVPDTSVEDLWSTSLSLAVETYYY
jgi:hypothetical protein